MNISSKQVFECLEIQESDIPQKCLVASISPSNIPDDDGKSGNKGGIPIVLIASIIGAVVVVAIVVVVVVIVVIKKKKSDLYDSKSQTLGSNLLSNSNQQSNIF